MAKEEKTEDIHEEEIQKDDNNDVDVVIKDEAEAKQSKKKSKRSKASKKEDKIEELGNKLEEINDKYIRLSAEFENYRKRTLKEKIDIIKSGGESTLISILPVYDDFERALQNMENTKDVDKLKEGVELIYNKFSEFLKTNGVKTIEAKNKDFDTDIHEAVGKFPVKSKKEKGKVIDVVEKGYMLHDKVIRFAKVVIGE